MLARSLERVVTGGGDWRVPARQNCRMPLIAAALETADGQFNPASFDALGKALALIVGPEAMVVFKDVLQVDEREAGRCGAGSSARWWRRPGSRDPARLSGACR